MHESDLAKNKRFLGGNTNTTHSQFLTVLSIEQRRQYDGVCFWQKYYLPFFPSEKTTLIQKLNFFFPYYFLSPENHDTSDGKITSLKLAEMFVSLLLHAEKGLNTSQVNCQDNSYIAGILHGKLKKTLSHAHIPAWKKTSKREKGLDLPLESSFSSCHSEGLPRRRRCHLDCWGSREG